MSSMGKAALARCGWALHLGVGLLGRASRVVRPLPGPVGHGQRHQGQQEHRPVAPGVQAGVLVLADDQHPLGARFAPQCSSRTVSSVKLGPERVRSSVRLSVKARLIGHRQAAPSPRGVRPQSTLRGGLSARNGRWAPSSTSSSCQAGQRSSAPGPRAPVVHGVEGAPEEADALNHAPSFVQPSFVQPVARAAGSRVYSRASGRCRPRASSRSATSRPGGMLIRMLSVRPPPCSPKCVPRSQTRLNST